MVRFLKFRGTHKHVRLIIKENLAFLLLKLIFMLLLKKNDVMKR
jgi:hypothetical protein